MVDKDFLSLVENGKKEPGTNWGCGILLIDPETGKVLLAKRTDTHDFSTPGGKIENTETPKQGIIRETMEEANIILNSMVCYECAPHLAKDGRNWLDFLFISNDFDASNMKNQESEMEAFDWYTIKDALALNLFPAARKGLDVAIELGLIDPDSDIVIDEAFPNVEGNGYWPKFNDCGFQVFNPYYTDTEGCSYSYNPDFIDWV